MTVINTKLTHAIRPDQTVVETDEPLAPGAVVILNPRPIQAGKGFGTEFDELVWVNEEGFWVRGMQESDPSHHKAGTVVQVVGVAMPEYAEYVEEPKERR